MRKIKMEAWRQELYHHGIKGQRWGVRKGPPYPLDAKDHTAAEKKAGWRRSLKGTPEADDSRKKKKAPPATQTTKAQSAAGHLDTSRKGAPVDFDKDKALRIARNVAIGAAVVGVTVGGAYAYRSHLQTKQLKAINKDVGSFISQHINGENATRLAQKLRDTPINELSDNDMVIKGHTQFQRIISAKNAKEGIMREKMNDVMYAVHEENDKNEYLRMYGSKKAAPGLKRYAMSFRVNKDIRMPSEKKRLEAFMDLLNNDDEFYNALDQELNAPKSIDRKFELMTGHRLHRVKKKSFLFNDSPEDAQQDYEVFQQFLGDVTSKSRKIYFDRLKSMGYNAIVDDNDALAWGHMPVILFDATNDVVIEGAKRVTKAMTLAAAMAVNKEDLVKPYSA